jgi:hypothetical protein
VTGVVIRAGVESVLQGQLTETARVTAAVHATMAVTPVRMGAVAAGTALTGKAAATDQACRQLQSLQGTSGMLAALARCAHRMLKAQHGASTLLPCQLWGTRGGGA